MALQSIVLVFLAAADQMSSTRVWSGEPKIQVLKLRPLLDFIASLGWPTRLMVHLYVKDDTNRRTHVRSPRRPHAPQFALEGNRPSAVELTAPRRRTMDVGDGRHPPIYPEPGDGKEKERKKDDEDWRASPYDSGHKIFWDETQHTDTEAQSDKRCESKEEPKRKQATTTKIQDLLSNYTKNKLSSHRFEDNFPTWVE
jgi:hypothetical protein